MEILGQRQFEYEMIVRIHIRNECMKGTVIYNENERNAKDIDILVLTHTKVLSHTSILRTNASQIIIIWCHVAHAKISTYSIFFLDTGQNFMNQRHPYQNLTHVTHATHATLAPMLSTPPTLFRKVLSG